MRGATRWLVVLGAWWVLSGLLLGSWLGRQRQPDVAAAAPPVDAAPPADAPPADAPPTDTGLFDAACSGRACERSRLGLEEPLSVHVWRTGREDAQKGWRFRHLLDQGLAAHPAVDVVDSAHHADVVLWLPQWAAKAPLGLARAAEKLVILDEADTMTADAQSALRRTMETHSVVTRFCLVCNYVSKIIAPLASRCAKFRFSALAHKSMKGRLLHICERENIIFENCSRSVLDAIVKSSRGDMRNAVNLLQTVSQQPRVTPESIAEISGEVPERVFDELWSAVTSQPQQPEHFEAVTDAVSTFVGEGYSVGKVLPEIQRRVVHSGEIEDADKAVVCLALLEADRCLNDGADEELQLLNTCFVVQSAF